jgi:hypothetical protein
MTVPPLPRDWASRPLFGKEEGSAPAEPVRRITADMMVKVRIIVFMPLLIYGEWVGVNRVERRTQNAECGM